MRGKKNKGKDIQNVNPGIKHGETKKTNKEKGRRIRKAGEMTEEKRARTK